MKVCTVLVVLVLFAVVGSNAQKDNYFYASSLPDQACVRLNLNTASVNCRMSASRKPAAVSVYGPPTAEALNPLKDQGLVGDIRVVDLDFENSVSRGFSTSISGQVFNSFRLKPSHRSPWRIYLSTGTPYQLHLDYGMGHSTVDLAGLSVEKVKISTGGASVKVGYTSHLPNLVAMDTFYTKVELGVLELDRLNLSRARRVIADVGFGKMVMYFTKEGAHKSNIVASVGAGTLSVHLEDPDAPVIVRVSDSPLCRIRMIKSFRKIRQNTFVSENYNEGAENLLSFDLDVSMGLVEFVATPHRSPPEASK